MTRTFRTIWISDIHLGSRGCQAERVLSFLEHTRCETLFLVGDIVDGWALARSWNWPKAHNTIIQKILKKARHGTRIVYVPGNHDEFMRQFLGLSFGDIDIERRAYHTAADGRRFLILHGDEFDGAVALAPWLSKLGASIYDTALALNRPLNAIRKTFGRPYWSLARYLKDNTKKAVQYIAGFEEAVARKAAEKKVDGVICGHIHKPALHMIGEVVYANCGDWVEHCTALVEHHDGQLEIIEWPEIVMPHIEKGHGAPAIPYHGDGLPARLPELQIAE